MKFLLHLSIPVAVMLLWIDVTILAASLNNKPLHLSAQNALSVFLPGRRLSSGIQDVTGTRSSSYISITRSEETSKSQKHQNVKKADKGIGDDPAIIRLQRLTDEEIMSALTSDELDQFYELRCYNNEYYKVKKSNREHTMSKEDYDLLKSRMNDYNKMLRLIRQRLVEAGQASWQTATELKSLPGERADFSPEELGWVLSPEEQREWERLSKGTSAWMELYFKKLDGWKLTTEEEEQFKINQDLSNRRQVMRRDILKRLIASPKAAPEQVERWKSLLVNRRIYDSARRAGATITNQKEKGEAAKNARRKAKYDADIRRMRQLAALGEQATEEERQELAALRARRLPKGPSPQRERLKNMKIKVDKGLPLTPEEQKEWDEVVVARKARQKAKYDEDIRTIRQLEALGEQATEDERQELAALRAKRLPKGPKPHEQRLKSIRVKVKNGTPLTPEEQKEWDKAVAANERRNQARREKRKGQKTGTKDANDRPSVNK